ncbi:MAG TPA: extracellular solute-binding protein [Herpetosiphonaceae bacterium]
MNVRRKLVPLLVVFSLLIAACGSPDTSGTSGTSSSPAASAATDASPAAGTSTEASPSGAAGESSPAASAAAGGAAVNMQVAWWGSQNRHDRTIKVLEMFMQQNPNVKLTWEFAAFGDYWTKLTTQAAGGNLPCLIQHDYQYIGDWVKRGLLMPLDDYVANGTIDTKDVDEGYLQGGRLGPDNKLYAISLGTNTQALIVDTQLWQEAGVEQPKPEWTWKEFETAITQLHEKLGKYGMSTSLDDNQVFKLYVKQRGGTLYNEEGTALGYDDDQIYIDFFTMLKGWMDKGIIPTREFEVSLGEVGIEDNLFVRQEAPMMYAHSNQLVAVASAVGERDLAVFPFPKQEGANPEPGNYLKPSLFWSITANCPKEQADVAAQIIDMFTNNLEANDILAAERGVPISKAVQEYLKPKVPAAQQKVFDLLAYVEQHHSDLDAPDPPNSRQVIDEAYAPLMDQVLYGQMSPEDAAPQFREQANAILSANQ